MEPSSKRTRLLSDDESDSDTETPRPAKIIKNSASATNGFTINAAYAKRFEHNKQREERHRLEENLGKGLDEDNEESSTSEEEDDDAELATADVDAEIMDTLQAIRNKDPRLYDSNIKFYKEFDPSVVESVVKEKPMYLQDYHRENLLAGHAGADAAEDGDEPPVTYQQEQDELRQQLVGSMHAEAKADKDDDSDGDGFLVKKTKQKHESLPTIVRPKAKEITNDDITAADKDPETYLSNFMAARAWLPTDGSSRFAPMESDDSEDEQRADAFEEAYNMRFEDPDLVNAKLQSFSRDVGKYGVRREDESSRKKIRNREQEQRDAAKQEKEEQKARLRKLRINEAEEKVAKIKEAAGLVGQDVDLSRWKDIIDGDFDDDQWDAEMKSRFGDTYYAVNEGSKMKKPKWDDDIDIHDLVPDFEDDDKEIQLSDSDDGGVNLPTDEMDVEAKNFEGVAERKKSTSKKDREKAKSDARKAARKQRAQIESMVDESMATLPTASSSSTHDGIGFRYRATSPTSFGLTSRDILFADDKQLNEYAGLKKLAAFRDEDKKRRDKKRLSKKARLRQWRKETFGNAEGPEARDEASGPSEAVSGEEGKAEKKKKKHRRGKKAKTAAEAST